MRFEAKAQEKLKLLLPEWNHSSNVWIEYECVDDQTHYCEVDHLMFNHNNAYGEPNNAVIVEMKLKQCDAGDKELQQLYTPVVETMWGNTLVWTIQLFKFPTNGDYATDIKQCFAQQANGPAGPAQLLMR